MGTWQQQQEEQERAVGGRAMSHESYQSVLLRATKREGKREAISSGCAAFALAALEPLVVAACLCACLEVVSAVAVAVAPHAQANNQMERIKFEKGIKATKWLAIFQNTSTCVRCPISLTQRIF